MTKIESGSIIRQGGGLFLVLKNKGLTGVVNQLAPDLSPLPNSATIDDFYWDLKNIEVLSEGPVLVSNRRITDLRWYMGLPGHSILQMKVTTDNLIMFPEPRVVPVESDWEDVPSVIPTPKDGL